MSSAKQQELDFDPWAEAQRSVDMVLVQLGHLGVHVSAGNQSVIEYWFNLIRRELTHLSFELQDRSESWRHDGG